MPDDAAPPAPPPALPAPTIRIVSPEGHPLEVPATEQQYWMRQGYTPDTTQTAVARAGAAARAADLSAADATAMGAARTVTLGGSDLLQRLIGGEDARIRLEGLKEAHPEASLAGELGGMLVPVGAASAAGRIGRGITALGEGAGAAGRLGAAALGGTAEGALYGFGQGVSEASLSPDLTVEHIGSALSSNMLYGGAVGGVAGGAGKALELGLGKARGLVQDFAAKQTAAQELLRTGAAAEGDLAGLDAKGLRAREDAELDRLAGVQDQQRAAARSSAVDNVVAYRQVVKEADPWIAMDDSGREGPFYKATKALRNALDDVQGLRDNPGLLSKPLRVEAQALEGAIANSETIAAKMQKLNLRIAENLGEELATLPDRAATVDLSGKTARRYASFTDTKLPRGKTLTVTREEAQGFLDALKRGEVQGEGQQALAKLPELLEQNRAAQAAIRDAVAPGKLRIELSSDQLTAIRAARDALNAPKPPPTPGRKLLSHVGYGAGAALVGHIPFVGPFLAPIAGSLVADAVGGAMGKVSDAARAASIRAAHAADAFLGRAQTATKAVAPLATKTLLALRYGQDDKTDEEQPRDLAGLYKRRTDELKRQVQIAPDGSFQMTQPARAAMAKTFDGIRPSDPILADRCEAHAATRCTYLASQVPRMPDAFASSIGPLKWQPSDLEMRSFARKCAAAEDPMAVLERVTSGHITPEDVQTMIAVYPELRNQFIQEVSANLGELRRTLPYERKLAMSMFTGVPVDPAMTPSVLSVLQSQFTDETGSMGGTQAPKAAPQFGSVSKSLDAPTPAQTRAEGLQHA